MKKNNDGGLFWVLIALILTLLIVVCCNNVSAQEEKENGTNECVTEDPHETEKIEKALVEQGYYDICDATGMLIAYMACKQN